MTARGHYLTALSLGIAGSAAIISQEYGNNWIYAFGDIVSWAAEVVVNGIYFAPSCVIAFVFLCGTSMGAWAPDWMECSCFYNGFRRSFIPHRTLTHTVALWVLLLALGCTWINLTISPWSYILAWLLTGFASSGLLHVIIDMLSPAGVPLFKPFSSRVSFRVYQTGSISELKVIIPIVCGAIGSIIFLNG